MRDRVATLAFAGGGGGPRQVRTGASPFYGLAERTEETHDEKEKVHNRRYLICESDY